MHPAHSARRRQRELGAYQAKVIGIAWPQHQAVLANSDRSRIAIVGRVANRQNPHDSTVLQPLRMQGTGYCLGQLVPCKQFPHGVDQ